jgi:hypothetical protein
VEEVVQVYLLRELAEMEEVELEGGHQQVVMLEQ